MPNNAVKPLAMKSAQQVALRFTWIHPRSRGKPKTKLRFPYDGIYAEGSYRATHTKVSQIVEEATGLAPSSLPGKSAFSAAKRMLRLTCPELWEEGERMEAEARMTGALLLGTLYLLALAVRDFVLFCTPAAAGTVVLVVVLVAVFMYCFLETRHREVKYTYLNTLLAHSRTITSAAESDG